MVTVAFVGERERCIVLSEPGLLGWFIRFQSRLSQKGRHWSFSIKQMRQFSRSGLPAKENTSCSSSIRTSKVLAKIIIKLTLLNFIFGLQVDNIHRENDEQDWGKSDIYFAKINTDIRQGLAIQRVIFFNSGSSTKHL